VSGKEQSDRYEAEARLVLAVKRYEMDGIATGMTAKLAGISRVMFMFELQRFGLSPFGVEAHELAEDVGNA